MKQLLEDLKTVRLDSASNRVVILDQTRLPGAIVYRSLGTPEEVYEAIYRLRVRGAPAIGVTAAYGMSVAGPWGTPLSPIFTLRSLEFGTIWPRLALRLST